MIFSASVPTSEDEDRIGQVPIDYIRYATLILLVAEIRERRGVDYLPIM